MNMSEAFEFMSDQDPQVIPREEFERFLIALTHDIRNKLNSIALEAADLSEQAEGQVDASRLQQYVQECSGFLKRIRESLAPEDPRAEKLALPAFVQHLRDHKYD
jgi:hypothetical protein